MLKFRRLGFDIRMAVSTTDISADVLVWPRVEGAYLAALSDGFQENAFELIDIVSQRELERLRHIVRASDPAAVVVEFAMFEQVAAAQRVRWLDSERDPFPIDEDAVAVQRYDVCDLDGFFSIFDMVGDLRRAADGSEDALRDACAIAQAANFLVPAHAPFVTVRLRVLKRD